MSGGKVADTTCKPSLQVSFPPRVWAYHYTNEDGKKYIEADYTDTYKGIEYLSLAEHEAPMATTTGETRAVLNAEQMRAGGLYILYLGNSH